MEIFNFKLLLLSSLCLAFLSLSANGQMCGGYSITVFVQDAEGKPIDNADIQFLPITKDETRGKKFVRDEKDFSRFSIQFTEGDSVNDFHKLIISADGYKTAENEIKFGSCRRREIKVKLPKANSAAVPVWEFSSSILFNIRDANGKPISGIKATVEKDGKYLLLQNQSIPDKLILFCQVEITFFESRGRAINLRNFK